MLFITYYRAPLSLFGTAIFYVRTVRECIGNHECALEPTMLDIVVFAALFIGGCLLAYDALRLLFGIVWPLLAFILRIIKAVTAFPVFFVVVVGFRLARVVIGLVTVAAKLFVGTCRTIVNNTAAIVELAQNGIACIITIIKRMGTGAQTARKLPADAAYLSSAPAKRVRVFVAPGILRIVEAASIWTVWMPQGTVGRHRFAEFTLFRSIDFSDFTDLVAAGAVVYRLTISDTPASAMHLALGLAASTHGVVKNLTSSSSIAALSHLLESNAAPAIPVFGLNAFLVVRAIKVIARKPARIEAVLFKASAFAPAFSCVEHPAFAAAMGLANPFAIKQLGLSMRAPALSTGTLLIGPVVEPLAFQAVIAANKRSEHVLLPSKDKATTKPSLELLTASPMIEPFALQGKALPVQCAACVLSINNSNAATRPRVASLLVRPVVESSAPRAVARAAKPWSRVPAIRSNGVTAKQKAPTSLSLSPARPAVNHAASRGAATASKRSTCTSAPSKSGAIVKPRVVSSSTVSPAVESLAHRGAAAATTTATTKQQIRALATSKNVAVQRRDSRDAVAAAMTPIRLLAAQSRASNLKLANKSSAKATKPKAPFASPSVKGTRSNSKRLIPQARFVSSSGTLAQDFSDSKSLVASNDWHLVSHDDAIAPESVKCSKRIWAKSKQTTAKLCQVASSVSLNRRKSEKANTVN